MFVLCIGYDIAIDLKRDLHFYTKTTIDTLDYSGNNINEGSKLVLALASPSPPSESRDTRPHPGDPDVVMLLRSGDPFVVMTVKSILDEGGLVLFESGAIVLHIGERSEALLPTEAGARARAMQWLIAALNSIEPFVMNVAVIDLFYAQEEWAKLRRPGAVEFVQKRLSALSKSLGDKSFLDGDRFTAGDLMMTTVLRILKHTDIVSSDRRLAAYIERCTGRPAFKRALDAQIGDFKKAA